VKTADWIVDMGPEGGRRRRRGGGAGHPEQIARNPKSYTGAYLRPVLARKGVKRRAAE
jgi:excinuclease ABC subunit A